jgi:hypothetical protein
VGSLISFPSCMCRVYCCLHPQSPPHQRSSWKSLRSEKRRKQFNTNQQVHLRKKCKTIRKKTQNPTPVSKSIWKGKNLPFHETLIIADAILLSNYKLLHLW